MAKVDNINDNEMVGELYDAMFGHNDSVLLKSDLSTDFPASDITDEDAKKEQIYARLDDGELIIDLNRPLLPYGATFYDGISLRKKCEDYFQSCNGPVRDKHGMIVTDAEGLPIITQIKPLTLAGLALRLGLETKELVNFAKGKYDTVHDRYSHIIKMAVQQIEEYAESRLYDKNGSQGARFILDSAFGRTVRKERAEVADTKFKQQQAVLDFKLKLQQLGINATDKELDIIISPKSLPDAAYIPSDVLNLDELEETEVTFETE